MRFIEKVLCVFAAIVFVTFLINHGQIDFSGVDFLTEKTTEALKSEEGQGIIKEICEISKNTLKNILDAIKIRIPNNKDNSNLTEVELIRVVDGDTIVVSLNQTDTKIRFIGVDTPESVNADESKNNQYGVMASDYTKSVLSNYNKVYLEFDEDKTDDYGRTLAYIWLKSDINKDNQDDISNYMLNGILVNNGYAIDKTYLPNDKYSSIFHWLTEQAKNNKTGLWQYDDFVLLW